MRQVLAVEDDLAAGRQLVADQQLDQRRLAGTGWADQEDEIALRDDKVHLSQGDLPVRELLGDVVEDEDRPFGLGLVMASTQHAASDRTHVARRGGDGHVGSAVETGLIDSPAGEFGWTPSAGTAAGAT